jgi:hypothetical protein
VLTLVNKETGEVRSRVVPDVTKDTLRKAISEQVNMAQSRLHSDGWAGYRQLGRDFMSHEWVDHTSYEYVRGNVSTNQVENYFSQLKRSIDGTHREHRYLAEFDFRYSTCKLSDSARMQEMIDQAGGRRLTYEPLKGRGSSTTVPNPGTVGGGANGS